MPGVSPEHRTLNYWIEQLSDQVDLDEVLMTPERIAAHNYAMNSPRGEQAPYRTDLLAQPDEAQLLTEVQERLAWLRERGADQRYLNADGGALSTEELQELEDVASLNPQPELRVVLELTPIRCGPRVAGLYTQSLNLDFDRNNCSTVHPQEPIQILQQWGELLLVRSAYTLGWIPETTPLSPPVPEDLRETLILRRSKRATGASSFTAADGSIHTLPPGTFVAAIEDPESSPGVIVATASGFEHVPLGGTLFADNTVPLTRRTLLEVAFSQLDKPLRLGRQRRRPGLFAFHDGHLRGIRHRAAAIQRASGQRRHFQHRHVCD